MAGPSFRTLLFEMIRRNGSDLHLGVGTRPSLRVDGNLVAFDTAPLTLQDLLEHLGDLLPPGKAELLERDLEHYKKQIPIGRIAELDEVASAVVFLAGDASSYMTGSVLDLSGGQCGR